MCDDTTKCAHFLIRKGIFDRKHALERLRSHEHSMEHIDATQWRSVAKCRPGPTIKVQTFPPLKFAYKNLK